MLWHIESQRDGREGHDAWSNLIIVLRAKLTILKSESRSQNSFLLGGNRMYSIIEWKQYTYKIFVIENGIKDFQSKIILQAHL